MTCYGCVINNIHVQSFVIGGPNREVVGNTQPKEELLHEREEPSAVLSLAAHSK